MSHLCARYSELQPFFTEESSLAVFNDTLMAARQLQAGKSWETRVLVAQPVRRYTSACIAASDQRIRHRNQSSRAVSRAVAA